MAIDFRKDLIIRWPDPQVAHVRLLQQIGIQAVLVRQPGDPAFEKACTAAGIQTMPEANLKTITVENATAASPGPYAALSTGIWPGLGRGAGAGRDDETASASGEPWVDANGYWIAWLRAMYPQSAPVLAYEANEASGLKSDRLVPFDTLALALAEARSMGGNYILSLDPQYRKALLADDPKATEAWKQLGETAKWLSANRPLFEAEPLPYITELVEAGPETPEIANLMYRRNASPRLVATLPPPSKDLLALVTSNINKPKPELATRILDHARQGAFVVTDDSAADAWWRVPALKEVKKQEDRIFYSLGKGTVVAYKDKVVDPSEHALDVIDLITHVRRAVRIWNANTIIAVASKGVVRMLNYGGGGRRGRGNEAQVRIQGAYRTATLHRPGSQPAKLETFRRGACTEAFPTDLGRVSAVVFE